MGNTGWRRWLPGFLGACVSAAILLVASPSGHAVGARTVHLLLAAGKPWDPPEFNFGGYSHGALSLTVPVGARLVVRFVNAGTIPHSLLVLPRTGAQPPIPATAPAFPGASTEHPDLGLAPGREETLSFEASRAGTYEFLCGVPGHALAGMWDTLVVSPDVATPLVAPVGAEKAIEFSVR